ncbi:MAG: hypothetical protein C3F14_08455 [Deltaproteobacteria bacterium]|nr:MAG: hypothetical protein C3F14_08455 [Deltaproteobacteria bacterium]
MERTPWNGGKTPGARDRIVQLLRRRQHTVEALAGEIGVTENAVRAQIALLQREGLVEVQGEVKGARRPAAIYGLRPGADVQFSRAYPVMLSHLVRILGRKLPDAEFRSVMRELGRQMAASGPLPVEDPRERIRAALDFLRLLGSAAEAVEENGRFVITGFGCAIGEAVSADARSCIAMAALLQKLTGLPVSERCGHGDRPSCRFEIRLPGK